MNNYIYIIFLCFCSCILKSQTTDTSLNTWLKLQEQYQKEANDAFNNSIVKINQDTMGLDSLLIYYYPNGNIYKKIPFINGEKNGLYEVYYSNGQLNHKVFMRNGKVVHDYDSLTIFYDKKHLIDGFKVNKCTYIAYDFAGNIRYITYFGKTNGKKIKMDITYMNGKRNVLRVYSINGKSRKYYWNEKTQKWVVCRSYK